MQYDNPVSSTELQATLATANISDSTVAAISSLLGLDTVETVGVAGVVGNTVVLPTQGQVDVVNGVVAGAKGDQVVVDVNEAVAAGASAVILQSDANLVVNVNGQVASNPEAQAAVFALAAAADTSTDISLVVTTGNGDDIITVNGDQNTHIDAGDGNDTIVTGNGNNTVIAGAGNNNVKTGSGSDTVILSGSNHADVVDTGAGYDVVQLDGSRDDYTFTVGNNFNVNLTGNQTAAISNAEFLTFVNGGTTETVALAHNDAEAAALRLYQGILGRDADLEGAKHYTSVVDNGGSLNEIANTFLQSAEFAGANNTADVNDLYQALLGRGADDAAASAWTNLLANGGSLADVAAGIAVSAEAQAQDASNGTFVQSLYEAALGREADQAGLDNWVSQLFNGASRADIAKAIVGSAEAGSKANSDFIDSLYQSALDRTADDAGKAHWAAELAAGASQADVALGIVGSAEAVAHIDNVVVLHGQV